MDLAQFKELLSDDEPPSGLDRLLEAMWHEAKGNWHEAHRLAQVENSAMAAWVHAYLHRIEGDLTNASYWYRSAGRTISRAAPADEWSEIVSELLANL